VGFWIRPIWKIWNITLRCWKWWYNICDKSMNLSVNSFFSNV
jgi:hypothetical protein